MRGLLPLFLLAALHLAAGEETQPTPSPSPSQTATPTPKPKIVPAALDPIFGGKNLWEIPAQDFVVQNKGAGFRWISSAQDTAESYQPLLTLFHIHVDQIVARFAQGKLHDVTVLFYNRGDAGELPRDQFDALVKKSADAVSDFTKVKFTVRGKDAANAVKAFGLVWKTADSQFLLEYSFTNSLEVGYRAEFVRLTISQPEKPKGLLEASFAAEQPAAKFSGLTHVKKDSGGDVFLEGIPMVDQGEKGYCVVASAERVMRYYGCRVDENELAQIANTDAEKGTSVEAMLDSLKKLSNRLRVRVRTVDDFDEKQFLAMITEYNQFARRGRRAQEVNPNGMSPMEIYGQMDPDILRESRTKNPSAMNRFFKHVQLHIDTGIPLLWSVVLGVLPQPKDPKGFGGHMRLIIGYNQKTNEIIYSDSWGIAHEMKRMPLTDAWTITTGMYTIEPL